MIDKSQETMEGALIAFLYITGCRISEALEVQVKDLRMEEGILYIRIPVLKRELGYDHVLPVGKETPFINILTDYVSSIKHDILFPINRFKAWRILHKLNEDIWPHVFRHNRANSIIEEDGSAVKLQIWMGWTLIGTADDYVKKTPHLIMDLAHKIK